MQSHIILLLDRGSIPLTSTMKKARRINVLRAFLYCSAPTFAPIGADLYRSTMLILIDHGHSLHTRFPEMKTAYHQFPLYFANPIFC